MNFHAAATFVILTQSGERENDEAAYKSCRLCLWFISTANFTCLLAVFGH